MKKLPLQLPKPRNPLLAPDLVQGHIKKLGRDKDRLEVCLVGPSTRFPIKQQDHFVKLEAAQKQKRPVLLAVDPEDQTVIDVYQPVYTTQDIGQ